MWLPGVVQAGELVGPDQAKREEQVTMLLTQRCAKCHGPLHPKADLNLSTFKGVARGGESGVAVIPTHAADSLLWQRVEADEMPPEQPLSAADKSLLREWIETGASGLPHGDLGEAIGADHWAFQSLHRPAMPVVRDETRVRTDIDRLVQSRLEAHGLSLGPDADRATLIRRIAFDLTGLPPTPAEIAEFIGDATPDAYEKMIDRYLASPRYGERWGQFWLDAAGYADSSGYFSNERDRPHAWRYRDYVIESFNRDLPFDQFVREQLAGDELIDYRPGTELPVETQRALIATHYLSTAPDGTDQSAGSPDAQRVDRYAALEGAQQVIASSLLGLSLKCARCHDHKFEPITQKEYYQVQSILLPALNPTRWVPPLNRNVRVPLPGETAKWQAESAAIEQKIKSLREQELALGHEIDALKKNLAVERGETLFADTSSQPASSAWRAAAPGDDPPTSPVVLDAEQPNRHCAIREGHQLRLIASQATESWVSTLQSFDWTPNDVGQSIQVTFDLASDQTTVGGAMTPKAGYIGYYIAMHDFHRRKSPGGNVLIDGRTNEAGNVYLDYPGKNVRIEPFTISRYVPGRNYGVRVTNRGDGKYQLIHLADFVPDGPGITLTSSDLPDGGFGFYLGAGRCFVVENVTVARGQFSDAISHPAIKRINAAAEEQQRLSAEIKKLEGERVPAVGSLIAWTTDAGPEPPEVFVLKRGAYGANGDPVQPSGLSILTDPENTFSVPAGSAEAKTTRRRLAFANWLTNPGSRTAALLARVQANRVWLHHFGKGLTLNPDNLGLSGGSPIHLELLEYLASTFQEGGWKFKAVHRMILTSTVYRQTSIPHKEGLAADENNRWLWRFPLQRLDAESIRDAMLSVSGELDLAGGGPFVPIYRYGSEQEVTRGALNREIIVKEDTPGAHRRSIFLEHRRMQIPTVLALFGTPSISLNSIERPASAVPLQSLSQLNSEFARLRSQAMAKRLIKEAGNDLSKQIQLAFELAVGRQASTEEAEDASRFVAEQKGAENTPTAELAALTDFCQMLFASNLFLYID